MSILYHILNVHCHIGIHVTQTVSMSCGFFKNVACVPSFVGWYLFYMNHASATDFDGEWVSRRHCKENEL